MPEPQNHNASKYKPEYCDLLIHHMANGLSFESFAGLIDVDQDTLYNWIKLAGEGNTFYQPFSDAKKKGVEKCRLFWERIGVRMTLGLPIKFIDAETHKEIETKRYNTTAWIFNMKNRFKWRDTFDVTSDDKPMSTLPIRVILNKP